MWKMPSNIYLDNKCVFQVFVTRISDWAELAIHFKSFSIRAMKELGITFDRAG